MTDTNIQLLDPENLPTTVIEAFGGDENRAVSLYNHINKGTLGCNAEWLIFQLRNPLYQALEADDNGDFKEQMREFGSDAGTALRVVFNYRTAD